MKIVNLILTYLFAAVFLILGVANYFFHFIPQPTMSGLPLDYMKVMEMSSKYLLVVKLFELLGGLMIAFNFRRALGWAIMLPITINIVLFELCIAHQPGLGAVLLLINLYMILFVHKDKFRPLLAS